jgi:hypothetical protein
MNPTLRDIYLDHIDRTGPRPIILAGPSREYYLRGASDDEGEIFRARPPEPLESYARLPEKGPPHVR